MCNTIVDGAWSNWSAHAACSVTCGNGSQTRTRDCSSPEPVNGGSNCTGNSSESQDCIESPCSGMSGTFNFVYFDVKSNKIKSNQ